MTHTFKNLIRFVEDEDQFSDVEEWFEIPWLVLYILFEFLIYSFRRGTTDSIAGEYISKNVMNYLVVICSMTKTYTQNTTGTSRELGCYI